MNIPASRLARFELRRFRGPLPKISLIFVLIVPLLYGAIYLTANWDPYGRLDRLPVAVVDLDQPAMINKIEVTAGRDFVASLHAKKTFDFHDVDEAEATRGLREGDYYLAIVVPSDFSANLVSGQSDDPVRAKIMLRRNDANGFVIGSITAKAQDSIARAVDESAVASYFDAVFANLAKIRSGLVEATNGAGRLETGLTDAKSGSAKLSTGSADAATGAADLATGAGQLATGLQTAKTGSADLAGGLRQLKTGSASLVTGSAQVAAGTQKLDDTVVPVLTAAQEKLPAIESDAKKVSAALATIGKSASAGSGSISSDLTGASASLDQLVKDHPELADDPSFAALKSRVDAAADRADVIDTAVGQASDRADAINTAVAMGGDLDAKIGSAKKNLTDLNDGAQAVAAGAKKLDTGIGSASRGADTLATGISTAATGAGTLSTGANNLSTGLTTLHTGAQSLDTGIGKLADGAKTLHDSLAKGANRIPVTSADDQAKAVQVLSSPADVTMQVDNPATYYGRGLAPMFFAIALWVFGISVFLVVRPITGRALAGRAGALRLALTGWLPIGAIAVVASWLMIGTVWLFLGLAPVHPVMIMGLVTLGAICFSAIAHLLRTALGTPGSSILLVWLILQLTSAGGTYPAPVLPGFFQAIAPYMPMTYLIDAFRVTISGGELSHLLRDVIILLISAAAALGLCVLAVSRRQQFSMKDLHPPLVSP